MRTICGLILSAVLCAPFMIGCGGKSRGGGGAVPPSGGGGGTAPTPLSFANITLPVANSGKTYDQILTATGGSPPYTFSVTSGQLPATLSLRSSGQITGTVTTTSFTDHSVVVTVRDTGGAAAFAQVTIPVRQ